MTPSPRIDLDDPESTTAPSPSPAPIDAHSRSPHDPAPTVADTDMDVMDKLSGDTQVVSVIDHMDIDKQHPVIDSSPLPMADTPSAIVPDQPTPTPLPSSVVHDLPDAPDGQRPAKRARTNDSDSPFTFTPAQHKFASSTVRTLKKQKDAIPFLHPVDIVALNIPHYYQIIKNPMDFSTVDRKLAASRPGKEDDGHTPRYRSADDFIADVKLVFQNCLTFNGPDHIVTQMAKRLEEVFDRQVKHMPSAEEPKPIYQPPAPAPIKTEIAPVAAPPSPTLPKKQVRRSSTSMPVIRRNDSISNGVEVTRPKREIHPPPPKDLPYPAPLHSSKSGKVPSPGDYKKPRGGRPPRDDGTADQLKFCAKIVNDMFKKQYYTFAYFFYEAVDAAIVPNYYRVIKKPMDLSTMRKKCDNKEYPNAMAFYKDFRLLMKNCETFNPLGTHVRQCGEQLEKVFEEKWAALPPLKELSSDESDDSDEERDVLIRSLEQQKLAIQANIDSLKEQKAKKLRKKQDQRLQHQNSYSKASSSSIDPYEKASTSKPKKPRTSSVSAGSKPNGHPPKPKASSSKALNGVNGHTHNNVKKGKKAAANTADDDDIDDDVVGGTAPYDDDTETALDLSQKKELSEAIEKLDELKLEKVIQIIQEGMPGIGNNSEEIELEIDALPPTVLQRLYNFVVKPIHKSRHAAARAASKPGRTGSGNTGRTGAAATGGVKRKSMDEAAEAEKIRLMEEKMRMFENGGRGGGGAVPAAAHSPSAAGGVAVNGPGMGAGHDEDDSVSDSSDDSCSDSDSE